jgi:hypothetical protein
LRSPHAANRRKLRWLGAARRLPGTLGDRALRERAGTLARFARFGLQPVDVRQVAVADLRVQRPVRCELVPERDASALPFLDAYMTDEAGRPDWHIRRSMQFRLLADHVTGTLPEDLSQTDYWRWHEQLAGAGINERPPAMIERKLRGQIDVFERMRADGYAYGGLRDYVWVLERPLAATRYGLDHDPHGLEVYDGHHRAAAAAALGWEALHVLVVRDVATHTPFGIPLAEVVRR